MKIQKGTRVYLPHLDTFGTVEEVQIGGTITKVKVKSPYDPDTEIIINTLDKIVIIARILTGIIPKIIHLVKTTISLFKFKKQKTLKFIPLTPEEEKYINL